MNSPDKDRMKQRFIKEMQANGISEEQAEELYAFAAKAGREMRLKREAEQAQRNQSPRSNQE